jgi:hypothetical protein
METNIKKIILTDGSITYGKVIATAKPCKFRDPEDTILFTIDGTMVFGHATNDGITMARVCVIDEDYGTVSAVFPIYDDNGKYMFDGHKTIGWDVHPVIQRKGGRRERKYQRFSRTVAGCADWYLYALNHGIFDDDLL